MRIPQHIADRQTGSVVMTPMIDVVFLLLIFFVCTASFQIAEEILPSSLLATGGVAPEVDIDPEPLLEQVVVKVQFEGGKLSWLVSDRPYNSLREVRDMLVGVARIDPTVSVILDVDGAVPLGDVIDVYDLCRLAGFDKIQFAASQKV